jgi:hypothetical protein
MYLAAILSVGMTTACVERDGRPEIADPSDVAGELQAPVAPGPAACATPPVEQWTGTARRTQDEYPDDVVATVTWQRVSTVGCVDTYAPLGNAQYSFAIPGAQCDQSIAPGVHGVAADDGALTIDRSTSPATYVGRGATTWSMTFTCRYDDGTSETSTIQGGDVWFEAAGTVDTGITGETVLEVGTSCGRGYAGTPCTYAWSFDAASLVRLARWRRRARPTTS